MPLGTDNAITTTTEQRIVNRTSLLGRRVSASSRMTRSLSARPVWHPAPVHENDTRSFIPNETTDATHVPNSGRVLGEGRTMSRSRSVAVITVAVGALLGALGVSSASAAPRVGTDASEVIHWNQVATTTLAAVPGPNGGAPPALQINMGMVQGAVYDAVNAIGPKRHRPYLLKRRAGAKASIDAAVATAAYDVLSRAHLYCTGEGAIPRSRGTPEHTRPPSMQPRSMRSTMTRSRRRS